MTTVLRFIIPPSSSCVSTLASPTSTPSDHHSIALFAPLTWMKTAIERPFPDHAANAPRINQPVDTGTSTMAVVVLQCYAHRQKNPLLSSKAQHGSGFAVRAFHASIVL